MQENKETQTGQKFTTLNLLVLVFSLYILVAIAIDTIFKLSPETSKILDYTDNLICIFFLIEFCVRFYRAESKLQFMKWGWIDLLASIPNINFLRFGRLLRLFRLFRIVRAFRSTTEFINHVYGNRAKGAFSTVGILAVLLLIFSSIAILQVEDAPTSNIKTAEDALWWAYATITTVGYGDKFPVTTEGRLIGIVLMTGGVGLFGTFSGFIASWFVGGNKNEDDKKENSINTK